MRFFILPVFSLVLSVLSLTIAWAADAAPAPSTLPADVQKTIDKSEKAIALVQQKADAEIIKLRQALIDSLMQSQKDITKKGDLDTALAIKAKIEEVSKAIGAPLLTDQGMDKKADSWFIGKWKTSHGFMWDIKQNGVCSSSKGLNGKKRDGTWKIKGTSLELSWADGAWDSMDIPNNETQEGKGTTMQGSHLTLTKE